MASDDQRIRERAHRLWEDEGRPEGRAEIHWAQAREIVALEENGATARRPVESLEAETVEPIEALTNLGEFPTLTDQGEMQPPQFPDVQNDPAQTPPRKKER